MIRRLIKTLPGERGKLFGIVEGQRLMIAECRPKIELYEHLTPVGTIGAAKNAVKKTHAVVVLCVDREPVRDADGVFFNNVSRFELQCDLQRCDGVFEVLHFDTLAPISIDLDGDWSFEAVMQPEQVRKLIAF